MDPSSAQWRKGLPVLYRATLRWQRSFLICRCTNLPPASLFKGSSCIVCFQIIADRAYSRERWLVDQFEKQDYKTDLAPRISVVATSVCGQMHEPGVDNDQIDRFLKPPIGVSLTLTTVQCHRMASSRTAPSHAGKAAAYQDAPRPNPGVRRWALRRVLCGHPT